MSTWPTRATWSSTTCGGLRDLVEATGARRVVHAVLVDAFVGARVPHHLVTAEALADLARVAGFAAVNVVDSRPLDEPGGAGGVHRRRAPLARSQLRPQTLLMST